MAAELYIEESLKNLKIKYQEGRENYVEKLLDYYEGNNTGQYIEKLFDSEAFNQLPPYEANITKRFINKASRIYTIGAKRNVSNKYDQLTALKDVRMKHIERMTRLIGTLATRVVWNGNQESPMFDYRPVYYFYPFFDSDPFVPTALSYPLFNFVDDATRVDEMQYMIWDKESWVIVDSDGNILQNGVHSYGRLPFIFTHREPQTDQFFVAGANDLINANEHINISFTEMKLGQRFQSFGQPVVTGADMSGIQRVGVDTTLELPEGATYDIVAPKGDSKKIIESIKFEVEMVAQNNHMWVQWSQTGGEVPSGISLMIKDLEYHRDFKDDVSIWKMYEYEMYEVEKAIAKSNNVSLPAKFGIDFNEPEYPKTVQDQILWDNHRLQLNLVTEAALLVEYNKDLTLQEAQTLIDQNKEKNKKLSESQEVSTGVEEAPQL
tara:strand:- start:1955 stop:3262 length:1308 start_codon:yes stop_codon:yes gene_type:complete